MQTPDTIPFQGCFHNFPRCVTDDLCHTDVEMHCNCHIVRCFNPTASVVLYVGHASRDSSRGESDIFLPLHYLQKYRAKAVVDDEINDGIHARMEISNGDRPVEEA